MTTSRTLAAALAIGALAAPAAQAQPADNAPADIHAPLARAAAANARGQDLRHLRAGAANVPRATDANVGSYTPGSTAAQPPTRRQLPGPPTWPVNPQPIAPAHAVKTPDTRGVNPTTIGLGIAGGLLAFAGLVGIARRTRRVERARVTA